MRHRADARLQGRQRPLPGGAGRGRSAERGLQAAQPGLGLGQEPAGGLAHIPLEQRRQDLHRGAGFGPGLHGIFQLLQHQSRTAAADADLEAEVVVRRVSGHERLEHRPRFP